MSTKVKTKTRKRAVKLVYKLVRQDMKTRNEFEWQLGKVHTAIGTSADLCGPGWLHFYRDPRIAVLLNPCHAAIVEPRLFEAVPSGEILHKADKSGSRKLKLVREIALPTFTVEQKLRFAIHCALSVCSDYRFTGFANDFLAGRRFSSSQLLDLRDRLISYTPIGWRSAVAAIRAVYRDFTGIEGIDRHVADSARLAIEVSSYVDLVAILEKSLAAPTPSNPSTPVSPVQPDQPLHERYNY